MKVDYIRIIRKRHYKIRHSRADIADHDAADHQHGHIPHFSGDEKHETHGDQRADKGCEDHDRRTGRESFSKKKNHSQSYRKLCSGRNSQDKGARYGIVEKGLEQES